MLALDGAPVEVAVTQEGDADAPVLHAELRGTPGRTPAHAEARAALERMLSLDLDLDGFHALAARDPVLAPLAGRFRGLRPPRFPSVFEGLVNAVALQQLSLAAGLTLLNRLSRTYGARSPAAATRAHAFPQPPDLAVARPASIRALGFSLRKAATIVAIAGAVDQDGSISRRWRRATMRMWSRF